MSEIINAAAYQFVPLTELPALRTLLHTGAGGVLAAFGGAGGLRRLNNLRGRRKASEMGKWLLDVEPGGADLVLEVGPVVGHVLVADPYGVAAAEAGDLDDARVVEVGLERGDELALAHKGKQAAAAEFHGERRGRLCPNNGSSEP